MKNKPNIVFICTDQLRFDQLGCTGNKIARTPNIDRIAKMGTSFTNHLTPCQICAPSRGSMFTGLYPRHHGMTRNGLVLDPSKEHFTHVLKRNGYKTYGLGKFHFEPTHAPVEYGMPESNAFWTLPQSEGWNGPFYGFDKVDFVIGDSFTSARGGHYAKWLNTNHPGAADLYLPENSLDDTPDDMEELWRASIPSELHYNHWMADNAAAFIKEQKEDEPFFLFISTPDPHHPWAPPAPYCDLFDPEDMPMPKAVAGELEKMPDYVRKQIWTDGNNGDISYKDFLDSGTFPIEQGSWQNTTAFSEKSLKKIIAYNHALVTLIDDCVGKVLNALDERGIMDETVIVFTSDHGEFMGDHGLIRKGPMPYRQLLQIPFLMSGPSIPQGMEIDALTSHLDIKDTLLSLVGVEGQPTDGHSLKPLLDGTQNSVREVAYAEYYTRAVSNQYNKTIVTNDDRLTVYPFAQEEGWGEYFDYAQDPGEHNNCFSNSLNDGRIEELKSKIEEELPLTPKAPGNILGFF
ncbi:sulfatase-like hydrolase/transferase [Amphritea sp. 2_MG-2023]|uniref:sulfatase family protein n=1 Tax=Amphritea TaxID=515417 RepID=UPI001C06561F|nr:MULTISPECIES: sulfatase-like hydrolase/transferase [Amphritea]MBU2965801.1 sulfatase-like hydrolase/transferase [Amphritea atlantica]MDO6417357.1 sulfatase-like hydrolase/transferase [Amphritea sp. 2_MG-2023]